MSDVLKDLEGIINGNVWELALASVLAGQKNYEIMVPGIAGQVVLSEGLRVRVENFGDGSMKLSLEFPDGETALEKAERIKEELGIDLLKNVKWHTE